MDVCEDIVKLKGGKFKYLVGKVTPGMFIANRIYYLNILSLEMLQSNSNSECYIKTNETVLAKLRKNAAKIKPNVD